MSRDRGKQERITSDSGIIFQEQTIRPKEIRKEVDVFLDQYKERLPEIQLQDLRARFSHYIGRMMTREHKNNSGHVSAEFKRSVLSRALGQLEVKIEHALKESAEQLNPQLMRGAEFANKYAEIKKSLGDTETLVVITTDLDDFKSINDEHGHVAGDKLLQ